MFDTWFLRERKKDETAVGMGKFGQVGRSLYLSSNQDDENLSQSFSSCSNTSLMLWTVRFLLLALACSIKPHTETVCGSSSLVDR